MKKFFAFFAAVLMAGSMMAEVKSDTIKWGAVVAGADLAASYASPTNSGFVFNQVGGNSIDANNTKFGTADAYDQYSFRFKAGGATSSSRSFSLSIPEAGTLKIAARTAKDSENRTLTLKQSGETVLSVGCPNDQTLVAATDGKGTVFSYFETEVEAGTVNIELSAAINFYAFILETEAAPASEWDGTVTLSKTTFASLADLEGLTLTFNGATAVALAEEPSGVAFQNEDGSVMYAHWMIEEGGTYTINGNTITLSNWTEDEPLPTVDGPVYFEDYGIASIDGEEDYFETVVAQFTAAPAVTYTVTYTVNGFDAEHCLIQAGYYDEDATVSGEFVAGANTVPENVFAYIQAVAVDNYTVEVKVDGVVVELNEGFWYSPNVISADMTIEVTFAYDGGPSTGLKTVENVKVIKSLKNGQVVIEKNGVRVNVLGAKL